MSETHAPAYLYQFTADFGTLGIFYWRYTSNVSSITSSSEVFTAWQIEHSSIRRSIAMEQSETTIRAAYQASGFWQMISTARPQRRVKVEIWSIERSAPDSRTLLLSGWLGRPSVNERTISISVASWLDALDSELPWASAQHRCNWRFGDGNCRFDMATRSTSVANYSVLANPRRYRLGWGGVYGAPPAWLYTDSVVGGQFTLPAAAAADGTPIVRDILAQIGPSVGPQPVLLVEFGKELPALASGLPATLTAGCNRLVTTCQAYGNLSNFGGFAAIPKRNISVRAWEDDNQEHGKK